MQECSLHVSGMILAHTVSWHLNILKSKGMRMERDKEMGGMAWIIIQIPLQFKQQSSTKRGADLGNGCEASNLLGPLPQRPGCAL